MLAALTAIVLLAACEDEPGGPELRPVTTGTISGIPFTVVSGTVYQLGADGPLYADSTTRGRIVLDGTPASLGMSDPNLLHLRTYFALPLGGILRIGAFGDDTDPLGTGIAIGLGRLPGPGFVNELRFAGILEADSVFSTQPDPPSSEVWIVTEFYADSVPGSPAGEAGAALWPLGDLTPEPAEELLGCGPEGSTAPTPMTGDAVVYDLDLAWLLEVEVVDQVVGPCT